MTTLINRTMKSGDSLGGVFEVFATGVPVGLGSYIQWDRRLRRPACAVINEYSGY